MSACPECSRAGTLACTHRLVLPGDRRSDEIALEILACGCGFKAIAVAEQLRRAALRGSERISYRLPAAAVDLLAFLIARCPNPAEEFCACPTHATLNRRDLRNQWNLLHSFAPFPSFAAPPATEAASDAFRYANLAWTRKGGGYRTKVCGREWRLHKISDGNPEHYELEVGHALGLELDAWPPFWHVAPRTPACARQPAAKPTKSTDRVIAER